MTTDEKLAIIYKWARGVTLTPGSLGDSTDVSVRVNYELYAGVTTVTRLFATRDEAVNAVYHSIRSKVQFLIHKYEQGL